MNNTLSGCIDLIEIKYENLNNTTYQLIIKDVIIKKVMIFLSEYVDFNCIDSISVKNNHTIKISGKAMYVLNKLVNRIYSNRIFVFPIMDDEKNNEHIFMCNIKKNNYVINRAYMEVINMIDEHLFTRNLSNIVNEYIGEIGPIGNIKITAVTNSNLNNTEHLGYAEYFLPVLPSISDIQLSLINLEDKTKKIILYFTDDDNNIIDILIYGKIIIPGCELHFDNHSALISDKVFNNCHIPEEPIYTLTFSNMGITYIDFKSHISSMELKISIQTFMVYVNIIGVNT